MSKFAPSVEAARVALGARIPIVTKAHPAGVAGIALSLDEVALRTRRGRNDPRVRSWAIRSIHEAGGAQGFRGQGEAILAAFRKTATYVQDPLGTEFIQAAHETLCLDDKGLCFKGGDCDDVTVAVAAACLSVGIPTKIVGQSFKEGNPPTHVLLAIQSDKDWPNDWLRIDPSTNKPVGEYVNAVKEWWIDPMDINDPTTKSIAGVSGGDFVGVGHIGLGDTAVSPSIVQGVTDQVTSGLYSLETSVNSLSTSLDMIAQVTSITGFDAEPTIPIVSVAQFAPSGLWTASMDKLARDFLSQGDFMVGVGHDALNGVRTIYMDAQSVLSIGKLPTDTFTWQAVAVNADIILAIFNPTGALLGGIATTLGSWLTPAQVQAAVPAGTVQGLGAIQLLPVAVGVAVAAACIVEALVVWAATKKLCDLIAETAREKSYRAAVALVQSGKAPPTILTDLNQRLNEAAKQDAADNPFDSGLDRVTDLLKWIAIGGLGVVAVMAAYPVVSELGHSAAAAIRGKREAKA